MTLVRWEPFKNVSALQDRINRMFEDFFPRSSDIGDDLSTCDWQPAVDIYETEKSMVIKAELPGIRKENVSVEIKNNVITLKGERVADQEIDEENYYRRERCYGTFQRSFTLKDTVHPEKIKATFKEGVLEVEIPKLEEEKPKQITVSVD